LAGSKTDRCSRSKCGGVKKLGSIAILDPYEAKKRRHRVAFSLERRERAQMVAQVNQTENSWNLKTCEPCDKRTKFNRVHPHKKRRFSTASASERGRAEEVNYALQMQTKATLALTRQQPRIRSAEINQAVLCIIIFFFFFFARIIKYLTKQGANQIPSNKIHFVDTKRTMGCWLFQCSLPLIAYEVKKSYWGEPLDARLSALLAEKRYRASNRGEPGEPAQLAS
jgi:hypothetical protein